MCCRIRVGLMLTVPTLLLVSLMALTLLGVIDTALPAMTGLFASLTLARMRSIDLALTLPYTSALLLPTVCMVLNVR